MNRTWRISCIFQYCKLEPYKGHKVTFKREHKNPYDKFVIAGKTLLNRKDWIDYCWSRSKRVISLYLVCLQDGAKFEAELHDLKSKLSPLEQSGLEIPIKVLVAWDSCEKLSILVDKIIDVELSITGNYVGESKIILEELGLEEEEDDEEVECEDDDDNDIQVCE